MNKIILLTPILIILSCNCITPYSQLQTQPISNITAPAFNTTTDSISTENESAANTMRIRSLMQRISEQGSATPELLHELDIALARNKSVFIDPQTPAHDLSTLFGAGTSEVSLKDHDLYLKMKEVLFNNVRDRADIHSFATVVGMAYSLDSIVMNNTEWSEDLMWLISDLALVSPKAMVELLYNSPDQFSPVMAGLIILCNLTEKKEQLFNDLTQLNYQDPQYIALINKIKAKHNENCSDLFNPLPT